MIMKKTVTLLIFITSIALSQTIYDVEPGTKGNQIMLTVANISELNPAEGVEVKLVKSSSTLTFNKDTETIELIEPAKEDQTVFTFDINRNVRVNQKDTVEFMITDLNGLMMMKTFIFNYTGPKEFKLEQNYPNPFNPTTTIQYQLPADARVTLKVYDILGSEVATLVNEEQEAGYKEVKFSATGGSASGGKAFSLASGMYIYRLTSGSFSSIKKMMLVK
jgi:hypothetical protein